MLDDIGSQIVAHRLLIPVRLREQALHPMHVRISQLLGHLPAVLAFHGCQ
jgi:hypothetical protein